MKLCIQTDTQTLHSTFTKKQSIPDVMYSQLSSHSILADLGEIYDIFPPTSRYFKECITESITDILDHNEEKTHYDIDTDDHRLEIITISNDKKTFHMTFQLFSKLNSVKKKFMLFETTFLLSIS